MATETSKINRRRSFYFPSSRTVTLSVAVGLFVVLCALPTLYMFAASLTGADGGLVFDNYRRLLLDARQRQLLLSSTTLSAGTAVLATLIGAPLGFLLARAEIPAKNSFRLLLGVPLVIPPYILALAWTYLGGANGLVTRFFGDDLLATWTYSLSGAILVLAVAFYPLAMLATEAAARRVDGHLEEAALLVAAPPAATNPAEPPPMTIRS
jgi:iron(III) transport system permease protein